MKALELAEKFVPLIGSPGIVVFCLPLSCLWIFAVDNLLTNWIVYTWRLLEASTAVPKRV